MNDCIYRDKENGWCKKMSDWSEPMPVIEYCMESPCPHYRTQPNTMREKALFYLYKKLKLARVSLGKAEHKKGAEREIENIKRKIEVLEWLTEIALKEDCEYE